MKSATATKRKIRATQTPYHRTIDLGNGVVIPVKSEVEARFVTDMIELARQGKVTLPKSNKVLPIPDNSDIPSSLDWRQDYEYSRSDRF